MFVFSEEKIEIYTGPEISINVEIRSKGKTIKLVVDEKTKTNSVKDSYSRYIFNTINATNCPCPGDSRHISTEYYLQSVFIDPESFGHKYDMDYTLRFYENYSEKRGGIDYYFPYGWKRYGLNLNYFQYKEGDNLDWLTMTNHSCEWAVLYHGTKKDCLNKIVPVKEKNKKLIHPQLNKGPAQFFQKKKSALM